ncbi:MAG: tripartite tricarboxylate transporter substrate binding protein [Betaproteobacteria bacterium]|nr:tripartite tricarboxylate transporter substrate binding protein [Betaproteobacteria bacterium]
MGSLKAFSALALGVSAAAAISDQAAAQAYPSKPIRAVVAFAPGGGTDVYARLIMAKLSERLGQARIVVDNRPGGGGYIGAEMAAKAPADGYTLFFTAANIVMSLKLYPQQPVDPMKDFQPVSLLVKEPSLLAVHPSLPVKSVKELIALGRANPGKINYGGGHGTSSHLNTELFKMMAKVNFVQIPYSGGTGPAVIGALIGEAPVVISPISAALAYAKSGRLRGLAITLPQRAAALPEYPAIAESLPGFAAFQWYGVLVPTGTPAEIVNKLHGELVKIMQLPDLRARIESEGSIPGGSTPQEFTAHMRDETVKWAKVVEVSGARAN